MEDKIDIHNRIKEYQRELKRIESFTGMSERDKELVLKFASDCKMGKTTTGKTRKKVGEARILKYLQTLRTLSTWLGKPFEEVNQEEMEKLVFGIEENAYKNRKEKYTEETKADYKKTLRKFYKWLGKTELVEFISLTVKPKDVTAIRREEAEALVNSTPNTAVVIMFGASIILIVALLYQGFEVIKE